MGHDHRPDLEPSFGARLAFSLGMGIFAALIATTLRSSLNEGIPLTLAAYAAVLGFLGMFQHGAHWRAASSLSLLLLVPCLLTFAPLGAPWSEIANLYCRSPPFSLRFFSILLFPIEAGDAALWGVGTAFMASMAFRWPLWGAAARPLRWLAMGAAVAALAATIRASMGRPDPERYLASRPLAATLFPTADVFTAAPERDKEGSFPAIAVGPIVVQRTCVDPGAMDCSVRVRTADKQEPSYDGIGCLTGTEGLVLREDAALKLWIFEVDGSPREPAPRSGSPPRRLAFRLDPASKSGVAATEITTMTLLHFTRPPGGWIFTPLAAVAVALHAGWRRKREAARGSLVLLELDLRGLTALVLSLLAIAPWLRELGRGFFG